MSQVRFRAESVFGRMQDGRRTDGHVSGITLTLTGSIRVGDSGSTRRVNLDPDPNLVDNLPPNAPHLQRSEFGSCVQHPGLIDH